MQNKIKKAHFKYSIIIIKAYGLFLLLLKGIAQFLFTS